MTTWRIEDHEGNVWLSEENLTAALAISVCTVLERDEWSVIEPTRSPFSLVGLLIVLFAQRNSCDLVDAHLLVMSQPMAELVDMLKVE